MAIAFDTYTNGAGTGATVTVSHAGAAANVAGVLVLVQYLTSADEVASITYGGQSLAEVTGSPVLHTTGELGSAHGWFLGDRDTIPDGTQDCVVTRQGAAATSLKVHVFTATAAADTEVVDTDTLNSDSLANPALSLVTPAGVETFIAATLFSGANAPADITVGADYTSANTFDYGTKSGVTVRRTNIATGGTITVDFTAAADDAVAVGVAVREVASGVTVNLGQVTETETSQAVTVEKDVAAAQVTETETAQAVTPATYVPLGQVVEAETPQALTVELDVQVAQVTETETGQALTVEKDVTVAQVTETETAQAITVGAGGDQNVPVGQVTETETAQAVTVEKSVAVAQVVETETGQGLTVELDVAVGQTTETETAQAVTPATYVPLGQVTETETPFGMTAEKRVTVAQTVETETAQAIGVQQGAAITPVGDITGEARSTTSYQTSGIAGVAVAGDLIELFVLVSSITPVVSATGLGGAPYTVRTTVMNSSMQLNHLTRIAGASEPEATINLDVSSNSAVAGQLLRSTNGFDATDTSDTSLGTDSSIVLPNQTISTPGSVLLVGYGFRKGSVPDFTLAQATNHEELSEKDSDDAGGSTNYAVSCSIRNQGGTYSRQAGTFGGETFTTDAGTFTGRQAIIHVAVKGTGGTTRVPVGQVQETETAQGLTVQSAPAVSQASEVETAQAVSVVKYVPLNQVTETETPQAMVFGGGSITVPLGQVTELETPQGLTGAREVPLNQIVETETAQPMLPTGGTPLRVGLWRDKNQWYQDLAGNSETGSWRTKLNRDIAMFDGNFDGPWSYYLANGSALPAEVITAYNQGHDILLYHKGAAGVNWAGQGSGAGDANFDALAASIVANIDPARPIKYTWHHEGENDQNTTPGSGMTPTDYIAAWRRVYARFQAAGVGTRVRWQMTYMNSHSFTPSRMEALWPTLAGGVNFIDIVSQQSYIACGSTTNIATKHAEDFQYLRDNRTATRQWSDLDGRKLAVSEYGMDLGGGTVLCASGGNRGTRAHRALGFQRILATLQTYVDYHCEYLTLFNARSDSVSLEDNTTEDGAAYQDLILGMNALAESPDQLWVIGPSVETETAQPLGVTKTVMLGQVVELEQAQPMGGLVGVPQVHQLGQVVEAEQAQPIDGFVTGPGPVEVVDLPPPDYTFYIDPPDWTFWSPAPDYDPEE